MMRKLILAALLIALVGCSAGFEGIKGPPSISPPPAGTAAELTTGTETKTRVWSPKILSDQYSGYSSRLTEGVTQQTFGAADTTPDVSNGGAALIRYWATGGAVTITDFDDGDDHSEFTDGDFFKLEADHAATLDCSSNVNLWCNGGNDYTLTVGEILTVSYVGTQWVAEITNGPGQIEAIADPDADRIYFWDDGAGVPALLAPDGTTVEISGTTLQVVSSGIGATQLAASAVPTTIASKSGAYTVGTDSAKECYGGMIYVTSAATVTACDNLATGMGFCVKTVGAIAVSVDVQSDDLMILDGTALDDGDKATNLSTAGDMICLTYYDATGWDATSNGWTDGGP